MADKSVVRVPIRGSEDIVAARREGRELASRAQFSGSDLVRIATAISELARNIVLYAGHGEITLHLLHSKAGAGIMVVAKDEGPGIPDIQKAMSVGYSTSGGLGLGLSGVRWLMDEMNVTSEVGKGTTVTARKWNSQASIRPRTGSQ